MKNPTPDLHADHDELLLARLFGDDVDAGERARAVELIASCPECAALYADLGTIADATRSLPVPPRPRDFTLTEAGAARLRPARAGWLSGWAGKTRLLGSSMAALGLAGVLFVGVLSTFGSAATTSAPDRGPVFAAAPSAAPTAGPAGPELNGSDQESGDAASTTVPQVAATSAPTTAPTVAATAAATSQTVGATPAATSAPTARFQASQPPVPTSMPSAAGPTGEVAVTNAQPSSSSEPAFDGQGKGAGGHSEGQPPEPTGVATLGGPDARTAALAACAALLIAGVLLLVASRLLGRRRTSSG